MPMVKTLDDYDHFYMRYPKSGTEDPEEIQKYVSSYVRTR
jgi:hypothetical protein